KPAASKVCSRTKWAMPHPRLTFGALSSRREEFFWYESAPTLVDGRFQGDGRTSTDHRRNAWSRRCARKRVWGSSRPLTSPTRAPLLIPHLHDLLHLRDCERGTLSWHRDRRR